MEPSINLIEELTWRGQIHNQTPGIAERLEKGMLTGYVGFDPTAASLHIGNLATIMLLTHLQRAGHKPIALVGGATGMVGDPSGKSQERNLLDENTLRQNEAGIQAQLEKFLDFDTSLPNHAEIQNNYSWFKNFGFIEFLREVGKHLTVNYMMAKDSVQKRLDSGLSFTEFSYQLLQAYDFYYLNKNHDCQLQMGGSDQWGNITSGTELIRRMGGSESHALTCPLVSRPDGTKFGKSAEGHNVWLDADMTSPYKFYQFWLNVQDDSLSNLLRVFTLFNKETIEKLEAGNPIEAKHALAMEVTTRVHSEQEAEQAKEAGMVLFGKSTIETLHKFSEKTLLEILEGVPKLTISQSIWEDNTQPADLLSSGTENVIFKSKGEARRLISGNGVSINKQKINEQNSTADTQLLHGKYLLVQKGKKNYYLIEVEK